jgi:hypothetical protein
MDGRNKQGDEEEEWTYIGSRGKTVIYSGIENEEAWERVEEFRIEERVEAHHLEITLRERMGRKEEKRKGVGDRNETVKFFWNCCLMFKENVIRNRKGHRAK